jgi:fumarate hydratase class II
LRANRQSPGGHKPDYPNDHVNMSQSSNSFATAVNVTAAIGVKRKLMGRCGVAPNAGLKTRVLAANRET